MTSGPTNASAPSPQTPHHNDGAAIRIVTVEGIPIRIHFTFLLLLLWVAAVGIGEGTQHTWISVIFVIALFACVVLHELGHALTALRYGIHTRDITLYPIGGIASLEQMPEPKSELWIALAGPAVNLLISIILGIGLSIAHISFAPSSKSGGVTTILVDLFWANIILMAFNMLPAFPMDGGRVLRALLARRMDPVEATRIAASVGQGFALLIGLFSVLTLNFLLGLIAVFVFIAAGQESAAFQSHALMSGHKVKEAMLCEFHTLNSGDSLRKASEALLSGSQHDFPVMNGEEVIGLLTRSNLLRGLAADGPDAYVAGVMDRDFAAVTPYDLLEEALQTRGGETVLVMEPAVSASSSPRLVGMLTQENMMEFLMLTRLHAVQVIQSSAPPPTSPQS